MNKNMKLLKKEAKAIFKQYYMKKLASYLLAKTVSEA